MRIGQIEVCIVRLDETFLAVQNACTHLGERLHKGHINYLGEIICPLHAYRFNLKTGEETKQRCAALDTFQVVEKDGILFLELDA